MRIQLSRPIELADGETFDGAGRTYEVPPGGNFDAFVLAYGRCVLRNCTIELGENTGEKVQHAVRVGTHDALKSRIVLDNVKCHCSKGKQNGAIIRNVKRILIVNCDFAFSKTGWGIHTYDTESMVIAGCYGHHNYLNGFKVLANGINTIMDNCLAEENRRDGFSWGQGGRNSTMLNCKAVRNGGHDADYDPDPKDLTGVGNGMSIKQGYPQGEYGIATAVQVIGCHFENNAGNGIFHQDHKPDQPVVFGFDISNCTATGNGDAGFFCTGRIKISNSRAWRNGIGLMLQRDSKLCQISQLDCFANGRNLVIKGHGHSFVQTTCLGVDPMIASKDWGTAEKVSKSGIEIEGENHRFLMCYNEYSQTNNGPPVDVVEWT